MMNHDATPTGHGLPLARRRSLVLALAGSAALAALPAGAHNRLQERATSSSAVRPP